MTLTRQLINPKSSVQPRTGFSADVEDIRFLIMQQLTTKRKDRFKNTFIIKNRDVPTTDCKLSSDQCITKDPRFMTQEHDFAER